MTSRVKVDEKRAATSPAQQRARLAALSNLVGSKKPEHLEKYFKLLSDFDFLTQKIHHPDFGLQALIEDYDLIDAPEATTHPEYNPETVKTLKQIQGALRLSAHILAKDKKQLAGQLLGRLLPLPPIFQGLLEQAKRWKQSPWLRPKTPSLTPPGGQLLRTLSGHSDTVLAVAVTPDGKQAISASRDKTLKVWDLATGEQRLTLNGHSDTVFAVAVTPDGKQAISGSKDNTLKVWDLATGEVIASFTGESWIYCCAVAPDGVTLVAGEASGRVHFLRLEGMEASP